MMQSGSIAVRRAGSALLLGRGSSTRAFLSGWRCSSTVATPFAFSQAYQEGGLQRSITSTSFLLPDPSSDAACGVNNANYLKSLALTKIVATIGPTSEQAEPMQQVVEAGMRIMRLNFSHATREEVELRVANLAAAQKELSPTGVEDLQDVRATLLDTKGPEIRTGKLQIDTTGHATVTIEQGSTVTLHTDPTMHQQGSTATDLFIDYATLHKAVSVGSKVLLDDGNIILTVQSTETDKALFGQVICVAENTGDLRSRAGVNLPLANTTDLPALSEKDKADILYGMQIDVDYVAASFVQTAQGVRDIKQHIADCAKILQWDLTQKPLPLVISKIETASALSHFDEILEESDGIMVARGDLGVEIPLQQVCNAQKEMVAACNAAGKPCIVATQMLESMSKNPRPTRAEVSDVTNAVYDGADAVMLSGETAKGKYPAAAVKMMNEIAWAAERYGKAGALSRLVGGNRQAVFRPRSPEMVDVALAQAAATVAQQRDCAAILVLTNYGTLPKFVAAFRPQVPILAIVPAAKIGRQLQLYRGVYPIVGSLAQVPTAEHPEYAVEEAKQLGYLKQGDEVVIVGMLKTESKLGRTASMKIATVP